MDGCVLLTSTPSCVVSPRGDPSGCALGIARRGETTHSGVDVNNTHPSMINPLTIPRPLFSGRRTAANRIRVGRMTSNGSWCNGIKGWMAHFISHFVESVMVYHWILFVSSSLTTTTYEYANRPKWKEITWQLCSRAIKLLWAIKLRNL